MVSDGLCSKAHEENLNFCVPIEMHGDDASSHKRRSFRINTMSSAIAMFHSNARGSTLDTRLLSYTYTICFKAFNTLARSERYEDLYTDF